MCVGLSTNPDQVSVHFPESFKMIDCTSTGFFALRLRLRLFSPFPPTPTDRLFSDRRLFVRPATQSTYLPSSASYSGTMHLGGSQETVSAAKLDGGERNVPVCASTCQTKRMLREGLQ